MASKKPKPRPAPPRSAGANLQFGMFVIAALAAGTFGVRALLHAGSAPAAKSASPSSPAQNRPPAGDTGQVSKTEDTEAANPIKRATVKMSPAQWESLDELFVRELRHCWNEPSHKGPKGYIPKIKVEFRPDGTLMGKPTLVNAPDNPAAKAQAATAMKAVTSCKDLNVPATYAPFYDEWRTRLIYFDPTILDSI